MKSIKHESINYQMTEKLLHMISDRTSGRKDFNQIEYEVIITEDQQISFYPHRCIYRSNRTLVAKYTSDEILVDILRTLGDFKHYVPGKYRYCYYTSNKTRRRWKKEETQR